MYSSSAIERVKARMAEFNGSGCWDWPMSRTAAGYGQLAYMSEGRQSIAYAHRAAYFIAKGPIPEGMHICHHCDNPACFNPEHLFCGTAKDNLSDMATKGRGNKNKKLPIGDRHWTKSRLEEIRGSANGNSKLVEADVLHIRESSEKGVALARRFGVTPALISAIRKRRIWRSV